MGVVGLELYGFIFSELQNTSNIAHSAHLGGMIAGFILSTSFGKSIVLPKFSFKSSKTKSSKQKSAVSVTDYSIDSEVTDDLEIQVDKILDKINEKGFGSLTDREKSLLEKAKSLFNTKNLIYEDIKSTLHQKLAFYLFFIPSILISSEQASLEQTPLFPTALMKHETQWLMKVLSKHIITK